MDKKQISIPVKRSRKIFLLGQSLIKAFLQGKVVSARQVASFIGKIMSFWVVAGPSSRRRGRLIYEELAVAVGLPIDATKWV